MIVDMKVNVLEALLTSAFLYSVGSGLFLINKTLITWAVDDVFGYFQRKGAKAYIRAAYKIELEEEEAKLVTAERSQCQDFKPPPVQVIDDVGKKCD